MSQSEYEKKFKDALKYINQTSQHLALAWDLVQKSGSLNSAEELYEEFKEDMLSIALI